MAFGTKAIISRVCIAHPNKVKDAS